jgi:hypothetical protein
MGKCVGRSDHGMLPAQEPGARTPTTQNEAVHTFLDVGVFVHDAPGASSEEQSPNPSAFPSSEEASQGPP